MPREIIMRLKTGAFPLKNFGDNTESFAVKAGMSGSEALALDTYKGSLSLGLDSVDDFDEIFEEIGPKKLFKVTIEPLPD